MHSWILAARPKTLLASVCPVAIGSALAFRDGGFHAVSACAALLGAVSIQVGTNFCNDYCDFMQGADTANRKGPTRAVQAGLISPEAMLRATAGMFAITAITCVYLVWRAGWVMAVLGIVSITLGILYTAGRKSLAYLGLGDIFVLLFFGPIAVSGTYFAQLRQLTGLAAWIGAVPGLISVGLLIINNLRDVDEDRQAGKKTLAVRFGRAFARWEYALCMLVAAIIPVLVWWNEWLPMSALMLSLAVAPGFMIARRIWWLDGAALNPFLGKTALVLLLFTVTFGVGCLFLW